MDSEGIGVSGPTSAALSVDEENRLAVAVRDTVRMRIIELIEHGGVARAPDLLDCPVCGDAVILLDQPRTFSYDRGAQSQICSACAAERDFMLMTRPEADIGGEGG